jgi:hypothetical protein
MAQRFARRIDWEWFTDQFGLGVNVGRETIGPFRWLITIVLAWLTIRIRFSRRPTPSLQFKTREILALALLLIGAPLAHAQTANCNLGERRTDGWLTMRRYEWDAFGFSQGVAGAITLRKAFAMPMLASVSVVPTITIVLHAGGVMRGAYPFDWRDWAFDAALRSAPAFWALGASGKTWQSRTLAVTAWSANYFAWRCWGNP